MQSKTIEIITCLVAGSVFAVGLAISGMTQPTKVVGFLDVTGDWDPSLALVMVGAIGVHLCAYRILPKMSKPLLSHTFRLPPDRPIDKPLITGAILFGVGWGVSGFCPGPALVSLTGGMAAAIPFVGGMLLGMVGFSIYKTTTQTSTPHAQMDA